MLVRIIIGDLPGKSLGEDLAISIQGIVHLGRIGELVACPCVAKKPNLAHLDLVKVKFNEGKTCLPRSWTQRIDDGDFDPEKEVEDDPLEVNA